MALIISSFFRMMLDLIDLVLDCHFRNTNLEEVKVKLLSTKDNIELVDSESLAFFVALLLLLYKQSISSWFYGLQLKKKI